MLSRIKNGIGRGSEEGMGYLTDHAAVSLWIESQPYRSNTRKNYFIACSTALRNNMEPDFEQAKNTYNRKMLMYHHLTRYK